MIFYGFSQMMAGALGGIPGLLTTMHRKSEDYDLPETLRANLAAEISKTGKFSVVASGPADAEVRIRVREYGFFQAGFMKRQVKPILTIQTQMVRHDGVQVWDNGIVIHGKTKGTPAMLPEQLRDNPALAREALHTAARMWAARAASALR